MKYAIMHDGIIVHHDDVDLGELMTSERGTVERVNGRPHCTRADGTPASDDTQRRVMHTLYRDTERKFIMVCVDEDTLLARPVVFDSFLVHKEIAGRHLITSAGFCRRADNEWYCHGRSFSLGIGSCPDLDDPELNEFMAEYKRETA